MKKRLVSLLIVSLIVSMFFVAGCGSSKNESTSVAPANAAADFGGVAREEGKASSGGYGASAPTSKSQDSAVASNSAYLQPGVDISKKIIKNANATIEVRNADEAFEKISKWASEGSGYEFSKNTQIRGQYKQINAVFKIAPDKLSDFLSFLDSIGKVTSSTSSSNDITDQYQDSSARLENLRRGRDQLLEIMKRAVTIDETLKVQNELNRITGEIEVLQGRLNMWDKLVDESSVNLTIVEEADPLKVSKDISWRFSSFNDILKFMKNGFVLTVNTIANVLVWIAVIVVSASPVIIIGAVAFIIYRKKRNAKKDK